MGKDGHLTIDDFVVASMNQYRNLSDAVIKTMFSHLDSDDDGWITPDDAFAALQPSGIHITVKELRKLFDKYGVKRRMGETNEGKGALTPSSLLSRLSSLRLNPAPFCIVEECSLQRVRKRVARCVAGLQLDSLTLRHLCNVLTWQCASAGLMTYHEFHELMMPSVSQRYTHELDNIVSAFRNNNNNSNPFNKLARRIVAENAPPSKDIEKIKAAFLAMDKDDSGTLTMAELTQGVRSAGYVVSDSDLNRLFKELDTDGTGLVRYHEFVAGAIDTNILLGDSLLRWVFDFMDDDDSDTITTANLKVRGS